MGMIPGEIPRFQGVDAVTFERLYAPGHDPVFDRGVVDAGLEILPGTVLGMVTATETLRPCVKTATDGSQTPYGVAHKYINTTANGPAGVAKQASTSFIVSGHLNTSALVIDDSWGATQDAKWRAVKPLLRAMNIFGSTPIFSGNPT